MHTDFVDILYLAHTHIYRPIYLLELLYLDFFPFVLHRIHDFDRNQHLDGNELFFALSEYLPLSEKMDQLDIETYYASNFMSA